jgi:hypothetical protein
MIERLRDLVVPLLVRLDQLSESERVLALLVFVCALALWFSS